MLRRCRVPSARRGPEGRGDAHRRRGGTRRGRRRGPGGRGQQRSRRPPSRHGKPVLLQLSQNVDLDPDRPADREGAPVVADVYARTVRKLQGDTVAVRQARHPPETGLRGVPTPVLDRVDPDARAVHPPEAVREVHRLDGDGSRLRQAPARTGTGSRRVRARSGRPAARTRSGARTRTARPRATAAGSARPCRPAHRTAECRPVPVEPLRAGVPVGVVERVTDDVPVIAGVVDEHVGLAVLGHGEAVVARAVLAGLLVGREHRVRALAPGGRVEQVGAGVRGEQAHAVAGVGGAGREGHEDPAVALDHRRPLVDPEALDLP